MLRTKEQETRLTLHEHDDDDDDKKRILRALLPSLTYPLQPVPKSLKDDIHLYCIDRFSPSSVRTKFPPLLRPIS
jgi:hypothetical protein